MNVGFMEVLPNGQIVSTGFCAEEVVSKQAAHFGGEIYVFSFEVVQGLNGSEYYFKEGQFLERPVVHVSKARMIADGADSIHIAAPVGSKVALAGNEVEIWDNSGITFTSDEPGSFRLAVLPPFPYQPLTTDLEVYEN